jgi:uncharacterized membrane protein
MFSLSTRSLLDGHYVTVSLLAAALVALLWLGPARARTTPRRRAVLVALRAATIALVIFAMLRPAAVYTATQRQPAVLAVMLDRSRSMTVPDGFGGQTRWQAQQAALEEMAPALADLAGELEVQAFAFDAVLAPIELREGRADLGPEPTGQETALGAALEELLRRLAGQRVAGILLLTDGAQRAIPPRDAPPHVPARQLKDLGYRLYAVPFGQSGGTGQVADVSLQDLLVSDTVFVKNQLVVSANARIDGFLNQDVVVQLLWEVSPGKLEVVDAATVRATRDGQQLPLELSYVPQEPGERRLALRAVAPDGETVVTNNELGTYVTVLKGGLNVLYVEGALRPEAPRLRRALGQSQDVQVDFLRIVAQEPDTRPDDLDERFQPGKYDVYILGDLDATAFRGQELAALRDTVDAGAGLVALGGIHSFGPGAYFDTPLADVLPIEMSKLDRQRFDEPVRSDVQLAGPIAMRPTRDGERHFVLLLDVPSRNAAAWQKLPPLSGANKLVKKPAATVLAESTDGQPLLVADSYGNGRVLAFAGDSTWRWCLAGQAESHRRFWRQLVLWLARKEQSSEEAVWIKLAERRYSPGSRVEFAVGARTPEGEELPDATLEATVTLPDGSTRPVRLARQPGQLVGTFPETQAPGEYTLNVAARQGDQSLGQASARFLVFAQDLELDNPAADPTTLASLAAVTGGRTVPPEQLADLLAELREQAEKLEVRVETRSDLYDNWIVLALFVALLTAEWALRKRWALV